MIFGNPRADEEDVEISSKPGKRPDRQPGKQPDTPKPSRVTYARIEDRSLSAQKSMDTSDPGWWDVITSAQARQNLTLRGMTYAYRKTQDGIQYIYDQSGFVDDTGGEGSNLFDLRALKGTKYEKYAGDFFKCKYKGDAELIKSRIDTDNRHREILANATWYQNATGSLLASVMDPVQWAVFRGLHLARMPTVSLLASMPALSAYKGLAKVGVPIVYGGIGAGIIAGLTDEVIKRTSLTREEGIQFEKVMHAFVFSFLLDGALASGVKALGTRAVKDAAGRLFRAVSETHDYFYDAKTRKADWTAVFDPKNAVNFGKALWDGSPFPEKAMSVKANQPVIRPKAHISAKNIPHSLSEEVNRAIASNNIDTLEFIAEVLEDQMVKGSATLSGDIKGGVTAQFMNNAEIAIGISRPTKVSFAPSGPPGLAPSGPKGLTGAITGKGANISSAQAAAKGAASGALGIGKAVAKGAASGVLGIGKGAIKGTVSGTFIVGKGISRRLNAVFNRRDILFPRHVHGDIDGRYGFGDMISRFTLASVGQVSPANRIAYSGLTKAQDTLLELVTFAGVQEFNKTGRITQTSAEVLIKRGTYFFQKTGREILIQTRKSPVLTITDWQQFQEEMAHAVMNGGTHTDKAIEQGAKRWINEVLNPLTKFAADVGLISGKAPANAQVYYPQIYDAAKIKKDLPGFKKMLTGWLTYRLNNERLRKIQQQSVLLTAANTARTQLYAAISANQPPDVIAGFQKALDNAEKTMRKNKRQLKSLSHQRHPDTIDLAVSKLAHNLQTGHIHSGLRMGIEISKRKGSYKQRTILLPQQQLLPWLNTDFDSVMQYHIRSVITDATLKGKFGDHTTLVGSKAFKRIDRQADALISKHPEYTANIMRAAHENKADLEGLFQRLRGLTWDKKSTSPDSNLKHISKLVRGITMVSQLAKAVFSIAPDAASLIVMRGLTPIFTTIKMPFTKGSMQHLAKRELEALYVASEITGRSIRSSRAFTEGIQDNLNKTGVWNKIHGAINMVGTAQQFLGLVTLVEKIRGTMLEYVAQKDVLWLCRQVAKGTASAQSKARLASLGIDEGLASQIYKLSRAHGHIRSGYAGTDKWVMGYGNITPKEAVKARGSYANALYTNITKHDVSTNMLDAPFVADSEMYKFLGMYTNWVYTLQNKVLMQASQKGLGAIASVYAAYVAYGMFSDEVKNQYNHRVLGWEYKEMSVSKRVAQASLRYAPLSFASLAFDRIHPLGERPDLLPAIMAGPTGGYLTDVNYAITKVVPKWYRGEPLTTREARAKVNIIPLSNLFFLDKVFRGVSGGKQPIKFERQAPTDKAADTSIKRRRPAKKAA